MIVAKWNSGLVWRSEKIMSGSSIKGSIIRSGWSGNLVFFTCVGSCLSNLSCLLMRDIILESGRSQRMPGHKMIRLCGNASIHVVNHCLNLSVPEGEKSRSPPDGGDLYHDAKIQSRLHRGHLNCKEQSCHCSSLSSSDTKHASVELSCIGSISTWAETQRSQSMCSQASHHPQPSSCVFSVSSRAEYWRD